MNTKPLLRLSVYIFVSVLSAFYTFADNAPTSLVGRTFIEIDTGNPATRTFAFGTDIYFELLNGVLNRAGTYSYNKLSATTGVAFHLRDGSQGDSDTITLSFTTMTNGTYSNARVRLGVPAGTRTGTFTTSMTQAPPRLTIIRSGLDVVLTWTTNVTGFTLQSTTKLASGVNWSTVSTSLAVINGLNTVIIPLAAFSWRPGVLSLERLTENKGTASEELVATCMTCIRRESA